MKLLEIGDFVRKCWIFTAQLPICKQSFLSFANFETLNFNQNQDFGHAKLGKIADFHVFESGQIFVFELFEVKSDQK